METVGFIYLIAYLVDCVGSIAATFIPSVEGISNLFSTVVSLFTVVVFVLGCIGKLRPRRVFLTLTIFYFCLLGFGMVLGTMLINDLGQQIHSQKITIQFLHAHFAWYPAVHLILLFAWAAVAVYGIWAYSKRNTPAR
ncbi:MAG: hypothetical protein WC889_10030 [Myxococcota bacterium]|jgi:hypothetical protein